MTEVQASKQLSGTTRLWRYLSLDKLVDLLSTSELFFTPLATLAKTDPFEGNLPSVAFDAHASISSKYVNDIELAHQQLAEHRKNKISFDRRRAGDAADQSRRYAVVIASLAARDCQDDDRELLACK